MIKQRARWSLGLAAALWCLGANAGPVDVNSADAETLALELTGVGPVLAAAIVQDRETNGRYDSPEALMRVKGIGEHIVEMNRENIRTGEAE